MNYEREEAYRMQDATEEMIRMREPTTNRGSKMAPKATATQTRQQTADAPQTAPNGNLPAEQQQKRTPLIVEFRDYVQARMATLEDALPPTIPPKRFVSVLMTALQNKPKLLECTFPSLWNACVRAAQDGLLPDGREGAIAPYGENKDGKRTAEIATWMPMIEGYRKKIFETGKVAAWEVNVVHEKDEFDYELGDNAFIRHKPHVGFDDAGRVVGAYSRAKMINGEVVREVMSAFQLAQIAGKSKAGSGPWKDPAFFAEMCKKTVARRHYKQLPHSESMDAMISRDDQENGFADPEATPIARTERRQLSSRAVMDTYAGEGNGEIIDNETGEVTDAERGDFQGDGQTAKTEITQRNDAGETMSKVTMTKDAVTVSVGSAGGTTGGASKEAGASGDATTAAPASDQSQQDGGELSETDGSDRPWPPGEVPTDVTEYERYLKTKLAAMTKAHEVAPWFNSSAEKELRGTCECAPRFKELQDLAIARRKELP